MFFNYESLLFDNLIIMYDINLNNNLINRLTVYARAKYTPKSRSSQHILICGEIKSTALHEFFVELFHR